MEEQVEVPGLASRIAIEEGIKIHFEEIQNISYRQQGLEYLNKNALQPAAEKDLNNNERAQHPGPAGFESGKGIDSAFKKFDRSES